MTSVAQQTETAQGGRGPAPRTATTGVNHSPPHDEDEAGMVVRAQRGDDEAFDWLYRRYHTAIWNYVYRLMGNHHDAEELTADAFLKAWLNLPKTKPDLKFQAWLYRVATNVCIDELRHRKLIQWQPWETFLSAFHPSQVARAGEQPERRAVAREDTEEVGAILKNLLPKYRAVLVLREYHDLSYEQIAEGLGTTRFAVKSLLYRAREDFRHFYARATRRPGRATERGAAPPPVALKPGRQRRLSALDRQRILDGRREEGARLHARRKALGLSSHAVCRAARIGGATLSDLEKRGQAGDDMFRRVREALDAAEAAEANARAS